MIYIKIKGRFQSTKTIEEYRNKKLQILRSSNSIDKFMFQKKFPFWKKRDIGVFTYI